MIDLQQNKLLREIPNNLLKDEKVVNLSKSVQPPLDERAEWINKINYTINLENLEEEILDHLLWEKHIGWNEGLALATTREQKINLIQNAIKLHQYKGTPYAIELVLETLKLPGEVLEWFQYDGNPYHFKVEVAVKELNSETLNMLRTLINEYKNKRSWLEHIAIKMPQDKYIELDSLNYSYPVYLPICGEVYCEGLPGVEQRIDAELKSENYSYPVYLPICGEVYPSEVNVDW